jgi:hypothetical protein
MRTLRGFPVFALIAIAVALAIGLAGSAYTLERFGDAAARAWRLGCIASLGASLISGLALAFGSRVAGQGVIPALGSMLLRVVVIVLAGTAMVLLLGLAVRPFLFAVAVSYLGLLIVDTCYALLLSSGGTSGEPAARR